MRRFIVMGSVALVSTASSLVACTGDDTDVGPRDGGKDATTADVATTDAAPESDAGTDGGDGGDANVTPPAPPYMLLSYTFGGYAKTEYAAISLSEGKLAGSIQFPKYGTSLGGGVSPWVLNQAGDVVMKMDATQPWKVVASWNVGQPKDNDAGKDNANPWSVAEAPNGKAYVAFYNRNTIAVLDATKPSDGGPPQKLIDVKKWRQTGDDDGYIEASSAVYVAKYDRVYVALGNIDLNKVDPKGFFLLCPGSKSAIGAIDVKTDTPVDLVGDGAINGTIPLNGVSPAPSGLAFDSKNDRLIVASQGCNEAVLDAGADAGPGPLKGRLFEQVSLADNATKVIYDSTGDGFLSLLTYVDEHRAFAQFDGVAYPLDLGAGTRGAPMPGAPDTFAYDGQGRLVGPKTLFGADGGIESVDIVAVDAVDAGTKTLAKNPLPNAPDPFGYEGVGVWPAP